MEHSPAHSAKFLPRYLVLPLFDQGSGAFLFFFFCHFLPVGQQFLVQDFLAVVESVFDKVDGAEGVDQTGYCYYYGDDGDSSERTVIFGFDVFYLLI